MSIILPKNIVSIIALLNKNQHRAHAVGGCVRDLLMGNTPNDWDVTTSATPEEVKHLFEKTIDTGIKHGTVTVCLNGDHVEVTTWRTESGYHDHRRPDSITYAHSLEDDLSRRDFTMNAMAWHPIEGLVDPFHGYEDIENKIIRTVGEPNQRFSEDALRMLRTIRFSAKLDFQIEEKTYSAIKQLHSDIAWVSMERIQSELNKILTSNNPAKLSLLWETGLSENIFPEIGTLPEDWQSSSIHLAKHGIPALLASLFYRVKSGAALAGSVLKRLKYDQKTIGAVGEILVAAEEIRLPTPRNLRKTVNRFGTDTTVSAAALLHACNTHKASHIVLQTYGGIAEGINPFTPEKTGLSLLKHNMRLSGEDILSNRLGTGKEVGDLLSLLELCLYEKPELNDKTTLLELAHSFKSKTPPYTHSGA